MVRNIGVYVFSGDFILVQKIEVFRFFFLNGISDFLNQCISKINISWSYVKKKCHIKHFLHKVLTNFYLKVLHITINVILLLLTIMH